jgi:predicted nucleotidyltransferase
MNKTTRDLADNAKLAEPVAHALADFAAAIRRHYGHRLLGLYLFGSHARGDHMPESDVDVAVVLRDGKLHFWREKMTLAAMAFDAIAACGMHLQAWPVASSAWDQPETHRNPSLIRAMHRDGRELADVGP